MTHEQKIPGPDETCNGCGIRLIDGYTEGSRYAPECKTCTSRRTSRVKRGWLTSPTGYAGEAIDNLDPKGRIIAA